jgi:hypothetical protein
VSTKTFTRDELLAMDLPYSATEDRIVDRSRWSIHREIVFEAEGKHWRTSYSEGATEEQFEEPWEYEPKVECVEVELREVTVKRWEPAEKSK